MKKNIILSICMILLFSSVSFAATHYVLGYSSVDNGEIRCGGSTKYRTQWDKGRKTWNALGKINIAGDNSSTLQDLTVKDVDKYYLGWAGYYDHDTIGADEIFFNEYWMDAYSSDEKVNVCTHELGHALGLAHSIEDNIMEEDPTTRTSLGKQDISDYNYLWD